MYYNVYDKKCITRLIIKKLKHTIVIRKRNILYWNEIDLSIINTI